MFTSLINVGQNIINKHKFDYVSTIYCLDPLDICRS